MAVGAEPRASNHFRFRCGAPGPLAGPCPRRKGRHGGSAACCSCVVASKGSGPAELHSTDYYRPRGWPTGQWRRGLRLLRKPVAAKWRQRAAGARAAASCSRTRRGGRRGTVTAAGRGRVSVRDAGGKTGAVPAATARSRPQAQPAAPGEPRRPNPGRGGPAAGGLPSSRSRRTVLG